MTARRELEDLVSRIRSDHHAIRARQRERVLAQLRTPSRPPQKVRHDDLVVGDNRTAVQVTDDDPLVEAARCRPVPRLAVVQVTV
jgi:hypothetical protein